MARLFRVVVPVNDIELAATYYQALLGVAGRRVSPGRHYFDCGGTILACYDPRADGAECDPKPLPDRLYFAVRNLEAAYVNATACDCSDVEGGIEAHPWGERSFYLKDPFGNPLGFVDENTIFTGEG